ncbi:hypothetical protein AB204_02215 [Xenorhabdus khoisanae]|uniref:Cytoplasmic protein n=1 Tax=Xenorhabdus khoisanae TaxID=880157 RepID=A0A0J5FWY3_9GAMM|nr:hypothetical protein AB204_02215 [Xenorhabdus khoisanae]
MFTLCKRSGWVCTLFPRSHLIKNFDSPMELQKLFPRLDNFKYRNKWWVIDIGGNNLRMIAYINFTNKRFYVKHIATHKEYDKLTKKYRETKE